MKIHEYQAKAIMAKYGIAVPKGGVASTPAEARQIAESLGGRAVVKAQVHAGGRGKAGGVKVVSSAQEAEQVAARLLGSNLVTHQTGPEGVPVRKVLVEETAAIAKELYLSLTVDAASRGAVVIASEAGGMEIEEVAARSPEKIMRLAPHPVLGLYAFQARKVAYALNLKPELVRPAGDLLMNLQRLFVENDCSLVEINPLVITQDNRLVALDGKINFDDDADFRHKEWEQLRDPEQEDPLERQAATFGVNYVRLDGDVGCLVNGAGLAMATMDMVGEVGARPANFLDVGGGADDEKIKQAFGIILGDPRVKKVLVNVFGGILRCDAVARGVIAACKETGKNPQIIVRLLGTNADEGRKILRESGLKVDLVDTLHEAAAKLR
ncbi:MAG: ADP-forming succinate--CoA ligase subunit beta [Dehalococcoidia bacterium]|nr:ADP-forming succinate--CoA ligase subunit beta [Dehalococcoidia bacterium]